MGFNCYGKVEQMKERYNMLRVTAALSLCLAACTLPLRAADADKDPKGWQRVQFGMSESEVAEAVGNEITKVDPPTDYADNYAPLRIVDKKIGGSDYDINFLFDRKTNKLTRIMMALKGSATEGVYQTLLTLLTEKYGKPDSDFAKSDGREAKWVFPSTVVGVSFFELPGLGRLLRVGYSPNSGDVKDSKDAL